MGSEGSEGHSEVVDHGVVVHSVVESDGSEGQSEVVDHCVVVVHCVDDDHGVVVVHGGAVVHCVVDVGVDGGHGLSPGGRHSQG